LTQKKNMPTPGAPISILLLEAAHGSLVNTAEFAARIAESVLDREIGTVKAPGNRVANVEDRGHCWSVRVERGKPQSAANTEIEVEIQKRDAAVSGSGIGHPRPAIGTRELAEKIATLILRQKYGEDELQRQQPLRVEDKGDVWGVRGSFNIDRVLEGPGPFIIELQKRDARVLNILFEGVIKVLPDVQDLLRNTTNPPA